MEIGQKDRKGRNIRIGDIVEIETSTFFIHWLVTKDTGRYMRLSDWIIINR